jgi:NAD(P)-dependent dehydrogenase (short-subunit alcohol dehydrogenase family)
MEAAPRLERALTHVDTKPTRRMAAYIHGETHMADQLKGKVAIVTGGASGMGEGMVRRFVAEGAKVVIADLNEDLGHTVQKDLGADASFLKTDVSEEAQITALVAHAVKTFGGLHVMVNNAGMPGNRPQSFLEDNFSDFHRVMSVNLLGVLLGAREAGRHMVKNGGGSIINISSAGGIQPGIRVYNFSKAAVLHFTKSAAVELGPQGVRVNAIAPSNIETPIMGKLVAGGLDDGKSSEMLEKVRAFLISRQPLQIQGVPEDIAQAALYLASDASRFVTGTTIPVEGGSLAGSPATGAAFKTAIKR